MAPRSFSHVDNFTGYMQVVLDTVLERSGRQRILDLPAGAGLVAERLVEAGHEVTCADINEERPSYVYANMEEPLPFAPGSFDTVMCMEGMEHVINPASLARELCRVCRPGGRVIVSTPNIQSCYSRLKFLFIGTPFQFEPDQWCDPERFRRGDRGHVSPLGYYQLRYLFEVAGVALVDVKGDKIKKWPLMPVYLFMAGFGYLYMWRRRRRYRYPELEPTTRHMFSSPTLFSRSLVLVFEKPKASVDTSSQVVEEARELA